MNNQLLMKIFNNEDARQNLSALRQEIKDPLKKARLRAELKCSDDSLVPLLSHTDAKTRKNTALLMGDLSMPEYLAPLFQGYLDEQQLFVRSSYLTALQSYDCSGYVTELKSQIEQLSTTPLTTENQKHIESELRALSKLIVQEEGTTIHTFTGDQATLDCILLTNRLHKSITEEQITDGEFIPFNAGVRVLTNHIEELLDIRTYSELLIVVPGLTTIPNDPSKAGQAIASSNLLPLLYSIHKEKTPFYFRIELKSKMALDEKSRFAKKFSSELERHTKRSLLNSTSDYEIELRLIENKSGSFNVLLKLFTINDQRFAYRKESVAASIRPVNAAQLVALAKPYMIEDSRTLDPFCGVGTMLIERQKIVKGNTSYGIDFYAPAIEKARINTEAAGQIIHYINRNFFDFQHEYTFDEIFTNMPYATGHKSEEEIQELYQAFFLKSREVLTLNGTIIMYSRNPELVNTLATKHGYQILESFEIVPKETAWLFILQS